jgi:DNA adenine methylase
MKPIVKWAGGKSKLLPELRQRLPTEIRTYAEPFAGGAALFFALAEEARSKRIHRRAFAKAVLADQNEELIACYRAVRDDVEAVITALGAYRYDKDLFYETRQLDTAGMSDTERAARLLFLNRTCFNGLWRVNASGKFNVPFGRYKNPRFLREDDLRAASAALTGVRIEVADFKAVTKKLGEGDLAYLDPPYVPLSKTAAFTAYGKDGFTAEDQERLADELFAMKKRGVLAMLSNADTKATRALYKGLCIHVVRVPRLINSDPTKRGGTDELIVTTWGRPGVHERPADADAADDAESA